MSTDVFTKFVYPSVMEVLESGWEQATPEKILVVLVLQRIWGVCMCFPNRTFFVLYGVINFLTIVAGNHSGLVFSCLITIFAFIFYP